MGTHVRARAQDPLLFHGGLRFMWRIGDYHNHEDSKYQASPKCFIDQPGAHDTVVGSPTPTKVTSYTWVYTW